MNSLYRTTAPLLGLAALAALGLAARPAHAQAHYYNLTQGYGDAYGGPSLAPEGGTRSPAGYAFTANQGLSLTSALGSLSSYSIEMVFSLASNNGPRGNGYQKLIDFKGLTSDVGFYDLNGQLNFFTDGIGPAVVFTPGQTADILLTRNGATGVVTAFAGGVQQFQFTDTNGDAVFASNAIEFFHDDTVTGNESATGTVRSIAINGGVAPELSQTAALGLGVLGLTGLILKTRRRRTADRPSA